MLKRFGLILTVCLLLFSAPVRATEAVAEDPIADGYLEVMIEVLQGADVEKLFSLLPLIADSENAENVFKAIQTVWEPGPCTWRATGSTDQSITYKANPATLHTQTYLVETTRWSFNASISYLTDGTGDATLFNASISSIPIGYWKDIGRFDAAQYAVFAWTLLCAAFSIFTIVDICRSRVRYKPLFIALAALVGAGFFYKRIFDQVDGGFLARFPYYSQLIYSLGGIYFQFFFPLGALLYWIFKKRLYNSALKRDALRDRARGVESDVMEVEIVLRGLGGRNWAGELYARKAQPLSEFIEKRLLPYASRRQKADWQIQLGEEMDAEAVATIMLRTRKARLDVEDQPLGQFLAERGAKALYLTALDGLS